MLGKFLEVDSKTLLLKTPYIYATVHSEMKLILIWEFHFYWLVFMILEGATYIARGGKKFSVSPSCEPWKLQQWLTWQDVHLYNSGTNVMGATNYILPESEARIKNWNC